MQKSFIIKILAISSLPWAVAALLLKNNLPVLLLGITAFILGLRHGLDADHIVAIDNVTRKLSSINKPCANTGLFFALGHSTIVFTMTVIVIMGVASFKNSFSLLGNIGMILGTLSSAIFLWISALINLMLLLKVLGRSHSHGPRGIMTILLNSWLFNFVDKPTRMILVGFCFGLGFDTATEISLLAMAASASLHTLNVWAILLLPMLFASGMIMTDSMNSLLMTQIYRWANQDIEKLRRYNIFMTSFAVIAAITIGISEMTLLISLATPMQGLMIQISAWIDHYSVAIGGCIVLTFLSVWLYGRQKLTLAPYDKG